MVATSWVFLVFFSRFVCSESFIGIVCSLRCCMVLHEICLTAESLSISFRGVQKNWRMQGPLGFFFLTSIYLAHPNKYHIFFNILVLKLLLEQLSTKQIVFPIFILWVKTRIICRKVTIFQEVRCESFMWYGHNLDLDTAPKVEETILAWKHLFSFYEEKHHQFGCG